ncbi:hypothetical protein LCGC14_2480310, partial [marine sediment metagenome]
GLERLQQRMPGLAKIVKGMDQLLKKRESMMGVLTDVDKKRSMFERAMNDLAASGEKLTGEQIKVRAVQLAKGIDVGDREIIKIMKDTAEKQTDYLKSQTEIQSSILDILKIQSERAPDNEQERRDQNKRMREVVQAAEGVQLQAAARQLPARTRRQALYGATGLEYVAPDRRGKKGEPFRVREGVGAGIFGGAENIPAEFKKLVEELKVIKTKIVEASVPPGTVTGIRPGEGTYFPGDLEKLNAQEEEIVRKLMKISEVRSRYDQGLKDELTNYLGANRSAKIKQEISKSIGRQQRAEIETAKQQLLASKYFNDTQIAIISQLGDANTALQRAAPHLRLSAAAEDLAKSLEDLIDDFKKVEALELDPKRIKSDLEGPFARVGKPGFKTDFETRREEAEAKLDARGSREEKKEAREELAKIEFDEEEARIKQKQDIEIKALKQQQAQAEKFRDIMAEALLSGEYAGEEIEGRMKRVFSTLGYELETAEEASMRGGKLRFKGIPSLQG